MASLKKRPRTPLTAKECFETVAHYYFPDGCPVRHLQSIWPQRTHRQAISAQQLTRALQHWPLQQPVTTLQLQAMILLAAHVSSQHLSVILKSCLPMPETQLETSSVLQLLALLKQQDGVVLQFLYLWWPRLTRKARIVLEHLYGMILALHGSQNHSVPLLLLLTIHQHATSSNVRRVRNLYQQHPTPALYALYQRLVILGRHDGVPLVPLHTSNNKWQNVPDASWESNVFQELRTTTTTATLLSLLQQSNELFDNDTHGSTQQQLVLWQQGWYRQSSTHSVDRSKVVHQLLQTCRYDRFLTPSATKFVIQHILPMWDGSNDDVLPLIGKLPPPPHDAMQHFHHDCLQWLEPFLGQATVIYALSDMMSSWDDSALQTDVMLWMDQCLSSTLLVSSCQGLRVAAAHVWETFLSTNNHHNATTTTTTIPSSILVYGLLLVPTAGSVERLCGMLLALRPALQQLDRNATQHQVSNADRMDLYNSWIHDVCHFLWLGSEGCNRDRSILWSSSSVADTNKPSLTHGMAFAGFALRYCQTKGRLVDDLGTSRSLKVKYLDHLQSLGFECIHRFLHTFVNSLAKRSKRDDDYR